MKINLGAVGILAIVIVAFGAVAHSSPLLGKDFFWFETDDGRVVPAFLIDKFPIPTRAVEDDVDFWHYLPGEQEGRLITPDCSDNCLAHFIKGAPLVLAAHGFGSNHLRGLGIHTRGGFGNRSEDFNLVYINYAKLVAVPDYAGAVRNVPAVGEYTARLINFLVEQGLANLDQTYFIGHSLGAHMANHVAQHLNGGQMKAIFALDPAWPLYGSKEDDERIDPSDAQFVNVIHTSKDYLGFSEPRGHVDFYPNSGEDQPGCGFDPIDRCSHSRSYHFLGESIGWPRAFPACQCESWKEFDEGRCSCDDQILMGWETPSASRGIYYLRTNADSPYGQH